MHTYYTRERDVRIRKDSTKSEGGNTLNAQNVDLEVFAVYALN